MTLGLVLPQPLTIHGETQIPPSWIRIQGNRAFISGHGPQNPDGTIAGPIGKVGSEVTLEQASASAKLATLSILSTLKRELGSLDRIDAWLVINGFVNVAPGFTDTTKVMNSCSELVLQLFGNEIGKHARTAMGVATTPYGLPIVISAELEIR